MATILTTVGTLTNMKFRHDHALRDEEFLFSSRAAKQYDEQSRHIPSLRSKGSALFVFEILKDHKVTRRVLKDYTENNLITSTILEMKCKMMFPNSTEPRYGYFQLVKKGEQDLICLTDRDYFVSVRGYCISHCTIELESITNLLYTKSNVIQFYSKAEKESKNANTLEQFAYDFFVKDIMPFASMAQKVTCVKIGIQLNQPETKYYREETDFHVGDFFVKTEIGLVATCTRYTGKKKRKLVDTECAEIANETEHAHENVLDTSKYAYHDDFSTFHGVRW